MKIRLVLAAIALFAQTATIADSQISGKYPKEQYHWDFGGSQTTLHYTPCKTRMTSIRSQKDWLQRLKDG